MAEDSVVRNPAVAALDRALSRPIPMGGLEDALAAFRRRGGESPTLRRSAALIDSWRTTAEGAGSKTALGATLHARSLRSSLTRAIYTRLLFRGGNLKHAYPRGCLRPRARRYV